MAEQIQIKGIELLSEQEKKEINYILEKSYEKLKWKIKSEFILKLTLKEHFLEKENKDKRKKYSIILEISGVAKPLEAESSFWDLKKALHNVIEKIENEVEHRYHNGSQHKNPW